MFKYLDSFFDALTSTFLILSKDSYVSFSVAVCKGDAEKNHYKDFTSVIGSPFNFYFLFKSHPFLTTTLHLHLDLSVI